MRFRRIITLIVAVAISALALAACGSSGGIKTYTNKDYKFSLKYDSGQFQKGSASSGSSVGDAAFTTAFADPDGTKADGQYRDGLMINVYKLTQVITDETLQTMVKPALEQSVLPQLKEALGADSSMSALTDVTINGVKGFKVSATYTMSGTPFATTMYFLISGDIEYQLAAQCAQSRSAELEPFFTEMMNSFTVTS